MKTVFAVSKNEAMMIDEIMTAYGKDTKIAEIKKSWHGIRIEITFNNRRDIRILNHCFRSMMRIILLRTPETICAEGPYGSSFFV